MALFRIKVPSHFIYIVPFEVLEFHIPGISKSIEQVQVHTFPVCEYMKTPHIISQ